MILRIIRHKAFAWIMTWLAVIATFGFVVVQLHHYSDRNRQQATANTRAVLVETCQSSGNGTRRVLQQLLAQGKPQLQHSLKIGQIDKTEYHFQLKQLHKDQGKVKLIDCVKLYSKIH